jgi:hypothetical protein
MKIYSQIWPLKCIQIYIPALYIDAWHMALFRAMVRLP